jgi:hypothetical protein
MVVNLTHSQIILRYKENGGRIEPYTIVIMHATFPYTPDHFLRQAACCVQQILGFSNYSVAILFLKLMMVISADCCLDV